MSVSLEEKSQFVSESEAVPAGYADLHNRLGLTYHENGDLPHAADCFRKALSLNPYYTEASLNLTVTLNDMGEYDEARSCISKAALSIIAAPDAMDPYIRKKMANEHARLGDQYMELGIVNEGIEQYQKAIRLHPDLVDVVTKLGVALRSRGEDDQAIDLLTRAEKINPRYVPALIQLGLTYYHKGFFGLAFLKWEEAGRIDPGGTAKVYLALIKKEGVVH
jgi:tetratricopeptide (TPR) repeat protein